MALIASIGLIATSNVSLAQSTNEWSGGILGNWATPENWTLGTPSSLHSQVIVNGMYSTVTVDSAQSIGTSSLQIGTVTSPNSTRTFFRITNGGNLTTGNVDLGSTSNSVGQADVSVSGNGGTALWNAGHLNLARWGGTALLTISQGGTLHSKDIYLGERHGGNATMTIVGGTWQTDQHGTAYVGGAGTGKLHLNSNATASLYSLNVVGSHYTSPNAGSGSLVVNQSTLTVNQELAIGQADNATSGSASVSVLNGGKINTLNLSMGRSAQSDNILLDVSGTGSEVNVTGSSASISRGVVNVLDGGKLKAASFGIGSAPGGIGLMVRDNATVRISGTGSLMTTSNDSIEIGRGGDGKVVVAEGGTLRIGEDGDGVIALGLNKQSASQWVPNPPPPGYGTLQIGEGAGAGIIEASEIRGGGSIALSSGGSASGGIAKLILNHSDLAYTLAAQITYGGNALNPGSFSLEHQGTGTTILTASNSYNGGTLVQSGKLLVNGLATYQTDEYGTFLTGSATGMGTVTVAVGATLGGSGEISGSTQISGSLLASEYSGSLTFLDGLTLDNDSEIILQLSYGGANFQSIQVEGDFLIGSDVKIQLFGDSTDAESFSVKIFDHLTDDNLDYTLHFNFDEGGLTITQSGINGITLNVEVIPEPGSMVLLGLAGAGMLAMARRRRQKGLNQLNTSSR